MRGRPHQDRAALIIFLAALALHAAVLIQFLDRSPFARNLLLDAYGYDLDARELLAENLRHPGAFHQAPLYPYLVAGFHAIFGPRLEPIFIFQAILGALIPLLLYRIGRRQLGRAAGISSGVLGVVYGPLIAFAPRLLPTVPAIFLVLLFLDRLPDDPGSRSSGEAASHASGNRPSGSFTHVPRARSWILPGAILGALWLLRPSLLLVAPLAIGLALVGRLRWRSLAVLLGVAGIAILPVTLHHVVRGHGLILVSSNGGETFYHGNNQRAVGTYTLMAGIESGDILKQEQVAREIAERESGRPMNAAAVSSFWLRKGLAFITDHPDRYLWLESQKLRLMLGAREAPDIYSPRLEATRYTPILRLGVLSLPCILPLALTGLVTRGASRRGAGARARRMSPWLIGLIAIEVITLLLFYVSNRYRLPLEALLLLPAGAAVAELRERRTLLLVAAGAALSIALVLTAGRDRDREAQGTVLFNLGTSLARAGRLEPAAAIFRDSIELQPDWPRAHYYLGRIYMLEERGDPAIAAFRRAVELAPADPGMRVELAAALAATGRVQDAARELDTTSRLGADLTDWRLRAGRVWLGIGRPDAAVATLRRLVQLDPGTTDGWKLLIAALVEDGACVEARAALARAVTETGQDPSVYAGSQDVLRSRCPE